jgi:sigma-B regulation protein RsbU (phosphoserine phosphatase)
MDGLVADGAPPHADSSSLYDNAPCGLVVTAADGVILRANATFCRWVGREAAELLGRVKLQELLTMGGRIFHQTHWAPLLDIQGSVSEVKLEVLRRDGRPVPMVFNAVRRSNAGVTWHELAAFVAEDRHKYEKELLRARKRAEELLETQQEAQRALAVAQKERDRQKVVAGDRAEFAEQMMAIVSHDLRNPLSVIRMSTHLIGMGDLSSNQLRALDRLSTSTSRATRLIADLLDFSQARLGSGLSINSKAIDLHARVAECLEDLRLSFEGRSIVHEQLGQGRCVGSSDRLVQLIGNLVSNAVAYGAPDRPIVVRSTIDDTVFSIVVRNEGPVIPADQLPHLFDPMTRGKDAQDGIHSVGLGLFIVREIARAHRGTVTVVSEDGATSFCAKLPRFPDAAA